MTGSSHLAEVRPAVEERNVTVLIAHSHELMRRALRELLGESPGIEVVAEAGDLASTARNLAALQPDVLVVGLRLPNASTFGLPNASTFEFIRDLSARTPATGIVVVSVEDTPGFARQALDAGASGYVSVEHADAELTDAITAASHGVRYVSPSVAQRFAGAATGGGLAAI
jgi:two-component system response regulator NreC